LPKKTLDRITLSGVRLRPRIGASEEERREPQPCEADITFWGDFEAAASTDSLDKAIDYSRVLAKATAMAETGEYNLIETLAYRLARSILQEFPAHKVGIRLRKRPLSLSGKLDFVEIEYEEG
jgi:7,8-dihydroneopterin aldolase/epimerase/oxygenase